MRGTPSSHPSSHPSSQVGCQAPRAMEQITFNGRSMPRCRSPRYMVLRTRPSACAVPERGAKGQGCALSPPPGYPPGTRESLLSADLAPGTRYRGCNKLEPQLLRVTGPPGTWVPGLNLALTGT